MAQPTMADHWDAARASRIGRRRFLTSLAASGAVAAAGPSLWRRTWASETGRAADPHLAFGADPRSQMTVSWRTPGGSVTGQSLRLWQGAAGGEPSAELGEGDIEARTVARTSSVYSHAALTGLPAAQDFTYEIVQGSAGVTGGSFTTAPDSPVDFTFTALGDQGTDDVKVPALNSAVVAEDPALHFHVGDLCYAYRLGVGSPVEAVKPVFNRLADIDSVAIDQDTWDDWLGLISNPSGAPGGRGARTIPWMATVGNHEMEPSYGPTGYHGVTGRLSFPGNGVPFGDASGRDAVTYSFDYGNVRFIALDGNDANYEIPGNQGYLGTAQDEWLEGVLADANRADGGIDFIVVGYHQCSYCTNLLHASDKGLRDRWDGLFERYGVDLVINGHNHSYERAHPTISSPDSPAEDVVPAGSVIHPAVDGPTYVTAGAGGNERVELSGYEVGKLSYVTVQHGLRVPEFAWWSAARRLGPSSFLRASVVADDGGDTVLRLDAIVPGEGGPFDSIELRRVRAGRVPIGP